MLRTKQLDQLEVLGTEEEIGCMLESWLDCRRVTDEPYPLPTQEIATLI